MGSRRSPQLARPVTSAHRFGRPRRATHGVEGNARLTATTAALLLVLLALEGVTVLSVHALLKPHVFIGMVLIPPVLLKSASTIYRFLRYYSGDPEYRRKGPPAPLLRLLGPLVVILTLAVLATGVALIFVPHSLQSNMLLLHKASFVLWFGAMTIHVLGHIVETAKIAPQDFYARTRRQVRGAGLRQWAVLSSVVLGVLLGALSLSHVNHFFIGLVGG